MYSEITDPKEIEACVRHLRGVLSKRFAHRKQRIVGWPSGHREGLVAFSAKSGESVPWVVVGSDEKTGGHVHLLGHGDPNDSGALLIDLQFNFTRQGFDRTKGGAFVVDSEGRIHLAHRGIATRGKSRVNKALLLRKVSVTRIEAASDVRPGVVQLMLVGPVDAPSFVDDLAWFCQQVREAVQVVAVVGVGRKEREQSSRKGGNNGAGGKKIPKTPWDMAVNAYTQEFSGQVIAKGRKTPVHMEWRHGKVVDALSKHCLKMKWGKTESSDAIDLIVRRKSKSEIWIFEVKTSALSQPLYTAIGQLVFNGAAIARKYPDAKVVRHLVIPAALNPEPRRDFCRELGLKVVSYSSFDADAKFTFD
jgi:hypothetical protein